MHENVCCISICVCVCGVCHSCLKWNFIHLLEQKCTVLHTLIAVVTYYICVCVFLYSPLNATTSKTKSASSFDHDAVSRWTDIYMQHRIRCTQKCKTTPTPLNMIEHTLSFALAPNISNRMLAITMHLIRHSLKIDWLHVQYAYRERERDCGDDIKSLVRVKGTSTAIYFIWSFTAYWWHSSLVVVCAWLVV